MNYNVPQSNKIIEIMLDFKKYIWSTLFIAEIFHNAICR